MISNALAPSVSTKKIPIRPLISYAFSSSCMSGDKGNYFSALIPLFVPIAEKNKGKLFDPTSFCAEIKEAYGLHINPYVAESFAPSMVSAGLLVRSDASKGTAFYTFSWDDKGRSSSGEYDEFDAKLAEIFILYERFLKNFSDLTSLAYTHDEFEDSLISWLVSSKEELSVAAESSETPRGDLHYAAARFVQDLEKTRPDLFDGLAAISSGAVVSELVLDYQCPLSSNRKAKNLQVYLDAPFVMGLLELSGKQNRASAQLIFDQLRRLECQIYVFKHSCEELEASVGAVLAQDNNYKYGHLAEALRNREVLEDYARAVQRNPEQYIRGLGISIMDMSALGNQRDGYFSDELVDKFREGLINWRNFAAKDRDARSLAYVMRLRGGKADRDFLKSKCLFVTNNYTLATVAREFCLSEKVIKQSFASPIITVRTLSAILFLTLGSSEERSELSRKQLVSNCGKAVIATPSMMKAFYDKLKSFSPEKEEQIAAIINEPRSLQCIMDQTWGDPEVVSQQNFEKILEKAKEEIAHEQSLKHKEEVGNLSAKLDILSNDNSKFQAEVMRAVSRNVRYSVGAVNVVILIMKLMLSLCILALAADSFQNGGIGKASPFFISFALSLAFLKDMADTWPEYIGKRLDSMVIRVEKKIFSIFWGVFGFKHDLDTLSINWKTYEVAEKPKNLLP